MKSLARAASVLSTVALGILPSALFFIWVERNTMLPWIPAKWSAFQADGSVGAVGAAVAFDAGLFFLFAFFHTALAQPSVHRVVERHVHPRALRGLYMCVTGALVLFMMAAWKHTGVTVWIAPLPYGTLNALSFVPYWISMFLAVRTVNHFDPVEFVGVKQVFGEVEIAPRSEGSPVLVDTGFYGRVRHPMYLFTLLAFTVTPFMTLDRLIVLVASIVYLAIGIPIEERKLVRLFGPAYEEYRSRVPALWPFGRRRPRS